MGVDCREDTTSVKLLVGQVEGCVLGEVVPRGRRHVVVVLGREDRAGRWARGVRSSLDPLEILGRHVSRERAERGRGRSEVSRESGKACLGVTPRLLLQVLRGVTPISAKRISLSLSFLSNCLSCNIVLEYIPSERNPS